MKTGIGVKEESGNYVLAESVNCNFIRRENHLPIPSDKDDPITAPLSDVAVAAMYRFFLLRHLLQLDCIALSSFAAGIIGAGRLMAFSMRWNPALRSFGVYKSTLASWPSAVIKCAGAHMQRVAMGNKHVTSEGPDGRMRPLCDRMYRFVWACLEEATASTLSDDTGLRRPQIQELKGIGALVRPTPTVWRKLCQSFRLLGPDAFQGEPQCRLAYKQSNGNWGQQPLAPARTLALMQYAADIFPYAGRQVAYSGSFQQDFGNTYGLIHNERERYALWACGNCPDVALQMQLFDLQVAGMFDRMPFTTLANSGDSHLLYKSWARPGDKFDRAAIIADDEVVSLMLPPWSGLGGPPCPEIAPKKVGIFHQ